MNFETDKVHMPLWVILVIVIFIVIIGLGYWYYTIDLGSVKLLGLVGGLTHPLIPRTQIPR